MAVAVAAPAGRLCDAVVRAACALVGAWSRPRKWTTKRTTVSSVSVLCYQRADDLDGRHLLPFATASVCSCSAAQPQVVPIHGERTTAREFIGMFKLQACVTAATGWFAPNHTEKLDSLLMYTAQTRLVKGRGPEVTNPSALPQYLPSRVCKQWRDRCTQSLRLPCAFCRLCSASRRAAASCSAACAMRCLNKCSNNFHAIAGRCS